MEQTDDTIRLTLRLPQDAAAFLDSAAKKNYTSRNAEIVRSIRERMTAAEGEKFGDRTPSAALNNKAALQGGSSINPGN